LKALAEFIMQGLPQAVLATVGFAVLAMVLPPLGVVSTAVVALVALREGATQSVYVVVVSAVVLAVMMLLMHQPPVWGLLAGLVQWVPLLLLGLLHFGLGLFAQKAALGQGKRREKFGGTGRAN